MPGVCGGGGDAGSPQSPRGSLPCPLPPDSAPTVPCCAVADAELRVTACVQELKPDGANTPVTNENKLQYIHLVADWHLHGRLGAPAAAFAAGLGQVLHFLFLLPYCNPCSLMNISYTKQLHLPDSTDGSKCTGCWPCGGCEGKSGSRPFALTQVIPPAWLRLFNQTEVNQLLSGGAGAGVDVADLQRHATYSGGYKPDSPAVKTFWKVAAGLTTAERQALLKFVTSCRRAPLGGFQYLTPPLVIHRVSDSTGTQWHAPDWGAPAPRLFCTLSACLRGVGSAGDRGIQMLFICTLHTRNACHALTNLEELCYTA